MAHIGMVIRIVVRIVMIVRWMRIMSSPTFCPIVFARYPTHGHGGDIDAKGNLNSTDAKLAPQKLAPD